VICRHRSADPTETEIVDDPRRPIREHLGPPHRLLSRDALEANHVRTSGTVEKLSRRLHVELASARGSTVGTRVRKMIVATKAETTAATSTASLA